MPAIFTHRLFAEDAASQLPDGIIANQEQRLAFYLANQGPDPFFYRWRAPLSLGARVRGLGHAMHAAAPGPAFVALKDAVRHLPKADQPLGRAFGLGLLGHWCLDSTTHPFIYAEQADLIAADPEELAGMDSQVHAIIEAAIDSWLLWRRHQHTVLDEAPASDLRRTRRTDEVAGAILSSIALDACDVDLPPTEYGSAVDDMQFFYSFVEPAGSVRCRFLGATECLLRHVAMPQTPFMAHEPTEATTCDYANTDRLPWKDPANAKASTASFEDLYGEALARFADVVPRYLEAEGDEIVALFPLNYSGR